MRYRIALACIMVLLVGFSGCAFFDRIWQGTIFTAPVPNAEGVTPADPFGAVLTGIQNVIVYFGIPYAGIGIAIWRLIRQWRAGKVSMTFQQVLVSCIQKMREDPAVRAKWAEWVPVFARQAGMTETQLTSLVDAIKTELNLAPPGGSVLP